MFLFSLIAQTSSRNCTDVNPWEMLCPANDTCTLDENVTFTCYVFPSTICDGERTIQLSFPCRYCYQLPVSNITCDDCVDCTPKIDQYFSDCRPTQYCMGNSIFQRKIVCKAAEKSQKTAFLLSLFLGGFAADRFYLGYYISAVFKCLTIGGFGIAYMFDLFLILFGYLGPANGKLFVERI
ncbi:TM2 domain containing protein [Trichomonas vaginalis G3]|uniref:TM2 domain containing protein n=1 Tax=Trichomonas vaginalis (strain ATCC PRA-98 / G3) TaxID=412133 RepID=A2EDP9_TRIV3|nr:amyloid-beta binding [Trichomonas vaginalis G3]EAY09214.1 TM2 domain containing protein [Trichomonas vaginalis G3]KAI5486795.1 amyloid-beta binding [Trichomonas vaginalis G3]|eukprot:XP_001321437.1 TM2 domain containing protein [Trichomonas vaginalis G3]